MAVYQETSAYIPCDIDIKQIFATVLIWSHNFCVQVLPNQTTYWKLTVSNGYKYIIWTRTNYSLHQFILVIHDSGLDLNQYYQYM